MTVAVAPATKFTLKEAESKLLACDHDASTDIRLRQAFLLPAGIAAEDTFVSREFCMKRGKGISDCQKLATEVMEQCVDTIGKQYSAKSLKEAKLILKLYLCDVTTGNRTDRIYASEALTNGHVRLTLGWMLALKNGSVVLDGGRMTEGDGHTYGFGDITRFANENRTLRKMISRMCNKILSQTNIKSRYNTNTCGCVADA
jgi:hypothetical protein